MRKAKTQKKIAPAESKDTLRGLADFDKKFPDEQSCIEYLEKMRWNGAVVCPYCTNTSTCKVQEGKKHRCNKCKRNFTVITKTRLAGTKISARLWLRTMFLLSTYKKGYTSLQLSKDLNLSYTTAWNVAMKVRAFLNEIRNNEQLSGTVELDEIYVGRRKVVNGRRKIPGHGTTRTGVLGIIQRGGRVVLIPFQGAPNNELIYNIAKKYIHPSAKVMLDGATYYALVKKHYKTQTVYHAKREYVRGSIYTNTIESFWKKFRDGINGHYNSVSDKYLDLYCEEFMMRHSIIKSKNDESFDQVLKASFKGTLSRNQLKNRAPD